MAKGLAGVCLGALAIGLVFGTSTGVPPLFDEAKLDAEEVGYNREISAWVQATEKNTKTLYLSIQDYKKHSSIFENDKANEAIKAAGAAILELKKIAKEHLAALEKTLPPQSMSTVHTQYQVLLAACVTEAPAERPDQILAFEKPCLDLLTATQHFREQLANKPPAATVSAPINIVFHPVDLPFAIKADADGNVHVFQTEFSVSTPAGDFSLSQANSTGVKKLIIKSSGKERYFSLENKPFNIFVPSKYGVSVSYDSNVLVIEVVSNQH